MAIPPALLKTLNLVTYIIVVTSLAFHRELINNIYQERQNFLTSTPSGLIIPALVWFLLGGFVLVQWFDFAHDYVVEAIEWNLFASNLVMTAWIFTWKFDWLLVGELLTIVNAVLIWRLYIKKHVFTATNLIDYIFVHVPFSIYAGLVWLDVFQNFFTAFTTKEGGPTSWTAFAAAGAIVICLAIGDYHAEWSRDPDSWAAIVIGLLLLSIGVEQGAEVPIIFVTCMVSVGFLVNALIRRLVNNIITWHQRNMDDYAPEERRHLLG
ncbi:hypothetical protein BGX34_003345 [Mortierella sp. NVP85]|nr:hypothetical protein BGX34_003345 [Mortierella sp. NVP85]